jgi:RimJ/RimL family protein N-acetyltransferase
MAEKKPVLHTLPVLIGTEVFLRPATAEDIVNTYHWLLLSNPQSLSAEAVPLMTAADAADAFRQSQRSVEHEQLMIVRKKDKTVVGWIRFFNLNVQNRSAEFEVVVDPDERRKGHATDAIELLGRYLFDYRGLNKIYVLVPEYAAAAVALLESCGFKQDGTLRRHFFFENEFHDGFLYSLLRFETGK